MPFMREVHAKSVLFGADICFWFSLTELSVCSHMLDDARELCVMNNYFGVGATQRS